MTRLFSVDRTVITRHVNNVFRDEELDEKSNVHFLHIANSDKPVKFYSLDVIISVGYRVKSKRGIEFRRWANKVLKDYILKGYAVNHNRISQLGEVIKIMKRVEETPGRETSLLYFLTKNHSFSDGNKRIAATIFLYFLDKNNALFNDGRKRIDDYALTALTIMIAESKPEEKDMMVKVVMNCLGRQGKMIETQKYMDIPYSRGI